MVRRSAIAWHGCSEVGQPVDHRDRAPARELLDQRVLEVRATIASTQRERLRATSRRRLARADPDCSGRSRIAWPPSWVMPASKVTWVRSEGFSKYIASVRPRSVCGRSPSLRERLQLARAREHREQRVRRPVGEREEVLRLPARDQRADAAVGEDLEQDRVQDAAVDDVGALDAALERRRGSTRPSGSCRPGSCPRSISLRASPLASRDSWPPASFTPSTSVSSISFSAPSACAIAPAGLVGVHVVGEPSRRRRAARSPARSPRRRPRGSAPGRPRTPRRRGRCRARPCSRRAPGSCRRRCR